MPSPLANPLHHQFGRQISSSQTGDALGNDQQFITLLTTQLALQDPTKPLDTEAIASQISNLQTMQQPAKPETTQDYLAAASAANGQSATVADMVGYVGKEIEAEGNQMMLDGAGGDLSATLTYDLDRSSDKAAVAIFDPAGNPVYMGQALGNKGRNELVWDGQNSFTGKKVPAGAYQFTVAADDAAGNPAIVRTYTTGKLTSVDMRGEGSAQVGDINIAMDKIIKVKTAQ